MFGNIKLILDLLRTFGKYQALLPLVWETVAAVKAGDWVLVAQKIQELIQRAGLSQNGRGVLFGQAPVGSPGELPADLETALAECEAACGV